MLPHSMRRPSIKEAVYLPIANVGLTPPLGLTTQMPVGQMSVEGATDYGPEQ